ncbi:MAG: hypothetical protein ACON3Z_14730 [Bradymonadia bacterium]
MAIRAHWIALLFMASAASVGCESDADPSEPSAPLLLAVELPPMSQKALIMASAELAYAAVTISGASESDQPNATVRVEISKDLELTEQGYQITQADDVLLVSARNDIAASYGLYRLSMDLGTRYIHPEQTVYPSDVSVRLPHYESLVIDEPHFEVRGFHEHTQHPIVMSDYLLRPGQDSFRQGVSRYLLWLARNRQNQLTFHMLNTVDLDAWIPYMQGITAEASELGISVGMVIGFVDQQQNAFRLVKPEQMDSAGGQPTPPELQITQKLDRLASTGVTLIGFQIGTSEFTKPDENIMLRWLNLATEHLAVMHPEISPYAWIHTTCGLDRETGAGGPYYHLPLEADERLGAFVHTTMYYDLENPAPVYDCENFHHQRRFFDAADGQRELVYFPETAWWLGFDNNLPMITPIVGRSRQYDVDTVLPTYTVRGHVTFTTGREWTYWQYDHYLMQLTWTGTTTWNGYLDWIAPIYGANGPTITRALKDWTDRQWKDFYERDPDIYFYLAGELPQDELGTSAGIIARPTKPSFRSIVELSAEAFSEWQRGPLAHLKDMESAYGEILSALPDTAASDLVREMLTALSVSHLRISHTLALFEGVVYVRDGNESLARSQLEHARGITRRVSDEVAFMEGIYRYPIELLATDKQDSLTTYPYGYLAETRSTFFWSRRDEQLAALIEAVFNPPIDEWPISITKVYQAPSEAISIAVPDSPLLGTLLSGFVPHLVIGLTDTNDDDVTVIVGQDRNQNDTPDVATSLSMAIKTMGPAWIANAASYSVEVLDDGGAVVGEFEFVEPEFSFFGDALDTLQTMELSAEVSASNIQDIVTPFGIEPDALGEILKSVWGLEPSEPLPERLPLKLMLPLTAIDSP